MPAPRRPSPATAGASRRRRASRQPQAPAELVGRDTAPLGGITAGLRELAIEVIVVWLVVERRLVESLMDRGAAETAQRLLDRWELGLRQCIQDLVKLGSGHTRKSNSSIGFNGPSGFQVVGGGHRPAPAWYLRARASQRSGGCGRGRGAPSRAGGNLVNLAYSRQLYSDPAQPTLCGGCLAGTPRV